MAKYRNYSFPYHSGRGLRRGENFWLRLTTASAQWLRLLLVLFFIELSVSCRRSQGSVTALDGRPPNRLRHYVHKDRRLLQHAVVIVVVDCCSAVRTYACAWQNTATRTWPSFNNSFYRVLLSADSHNLLRTYGSAVVPNLQWNVKTNTTMVSESQTTTRSPNTVRRRPTVLIQNINEKALRETQTLRAGCKAEPKKSPRRRPFPVGAGRPKLNELGSLPLPINPV